ncbi:MAG: crossover junction endodeoxyribonuclease RuvC [Candidatus Dependentiae bacterium]
MIVLGIDPGFTAAGFAIIQKNGHQSQLLDCGFLATPPSKHLSERVGLFYNFFSEKIKMYQVTDIALETPFLGKNAQNFLKLGYLRGIIYLLANQYTIHLHEFAPREVKLSLTGFGGASKDQVARVILQLFPKLIKPNKYDVTDALAITLCGLWKNKHSLLMR